MVMRSLNVSVGGVSTISEKSKARVFHHLIQELRIEPVEIRHRPVRPDDPRAFDQLVAEGMVAIGMGVDEHVDRIAAGHIGLDVVQHLLGAFQVEQRIDQQVGFAIGDDARVRPAP